jgi:putative flippase GtrA
MTSRADKLKGIYDVHGEKLRYVAVGAWNTAFSILLFNLILTVFGHEHYLLLYWAAWTVAVVQSTVTMKYFVFRSQGHLLRQIGRAYVIYLPAQALSTVLLWLLTGLLIKVHVPEGPSVRLAQLGAIMLTTVFSYFGHKYFTFRVPLDVGEVADEELIEGPSATA